MEDKNELFSKVKRKCSITWDDKNTNSRINDIVESNTIALNNILGKTTDYQSPGQAQELFLNRCLYEWNNCLSEFENNYLNEIIQVRLINDYKEGEDNEE